MRFACIDSETGNYIYQYIDRSDIGICPHCKEFFITNTKMAGLCNKDRYFCRKPAVDGRHIYFFCLEQTKTKRLAQQLIKLTIDAYRRSSQIAVDVANLGNNAGELAIHNTRNLNAEINNKLLSLLNESDLMNSDDKVAFIESAIKTKPNRFAREILSVLKSTSQIMHEYNIVDFLHPSVELRPVDFGTHRAHTLCVMSFYLYEQELKQKEIFVDIKTSSYEVSIHWTTAKTAVAQLFDNCVKYCKPGEPLTIQFQKQKLNGSNFLDIIFEMTSLYFSKEESPLLTSPRTRGQYAEKHGIGGKGIGLGVIQRMMELNRGYFRYNSNEKSLFNLDGIPYCQNKFVLTLRRV